MTRKCHAAVVCMFLLVGPGMPRAASLRVSPARFIVHDVRPGQSYDIFKETGLRLCIFNDDDTTRTWRLSIHRPSERGRWERGYGEIPDASWFWFDDSEIAVGPKSRGYANLHLKIPDEEKYYNQHWVVTLGIDGKPGSGGIALAVDVRAQIETKSKADAVGKPHGLLAFKPALVRFVGVAPGTEVTTQVVVYNSDAKPHTYTIASLFRDAAVDRTAYLSGSFAAIPDARWLSCPQKIEIESDGAKTLPLALKVAGDATGFGKKWEEIVLIQPDEGPPGFIRVRVETREK